MKDDPLAQLQLTLDGLLHKFCSQFRAFLAHVANAEAGLFTLKAPGFTPPPKVLRVKLGLRDDVGFPTASMRLEQVFTALSIGGERVDAPGVPQILLKQYAQSRRPHKSTQRRASQPSP